MFKNATPIVIKTITSTHAGSGRELGLVDMPIQRESHTGIPKIEASSLKGSLREWLRHKQDPKTIQTLFGADNGNEGAGLIGFTDAKLLFYPIKSLHNIFAYVTCPYLLHRFGKDLEFIIEARESDELEAIKKIHSIFAYLVTNATSLSQDNAIVIGKYEKKTIELDEYSFTVKTELTQDYSGIFNIFSMKVSRNIVVLSDQDFIELISLCTEIITRNRIESKTGIVAKGQLFTEEYLPAESILYTLILENGINNNSNEVTDFVNMFNKEKYAQIGGNENIGKGIVELTVLREGEEKNEQSEK